jgi:Dimerisation domain
MATTIPHQEPTPERFFNAINAYELTEAMKAAVELEILTVIAEGNINAATIAKPCGAAERGVRILCDFLTIHGFLTKKQGAQYALAPDSALFLDRRSPYLGGATQFCSDPVCAKLPRVRRKHQRLRPNLSQVPRRDTLTSTPTLRAGALVNRALRFFVNNLTPVHQRVNALAS